MGRVLSGWDYVDPALTRLLRINFVALSASTVVLAATYVLGFRHQDVLIDLAVMVVSMGLMLASLPFTRRFGPGAPLLSLTASSTVLPIGATLATPSLTPMTTLLTLMPLFVGFPYLARRWVIVLMVWTVLASAGVAALGEYAERSPGENWQRDAIVVAASLPSVVLVMIYLVNDAYRRLREQSDALRAASVRMVQVADATRRGIERDLHDGAQQRLLAMSVTIERARVELRRGHLDKAEMLIGEIASANREVVGELRELARGIYPPLLTERGLVPALQATARRSAVPVTLEVEDFDRPSSEVENAAYFCILEALNNAAKHAHCSMVTVRLRARPGLEYEVIDDGVGFDLQAVDPGGMAGLDARMMAAGGRLRIDTAPGQGTTVRGVFPSDVDA